MDSFPDPAPFNVGGVDTHNNFHVAAVVDSVGRPLGTQVFAADPTGYRALQRWLGSFGPIRRVGVEGTGSYGRGLVLQLLGGGLEVIEVTRPNRQRRRRRGKNDVTDAIGAALAVLNGEATARAKTANGNAESVRVVLIARDGAVKARTAALNQFHALVTTAPVALREQLRHLSTHDAVTTAARLRPANSLDPGAVTRRTLKHLAGRIAALDTEIAEYDRVVDQLVRDTLPRVVMARCGIGPITAARLIATAGDNPQRLDREASFAALCGTSPVEASTGTTQRHRLNRGGDRRANCALWTIATTRMRFDPRTKAYVERRTKEGKTRAEIIRCLKRYIARELHRELEHLITP
jgi:transposase